MQLIVSQIEVEMEVDELKRPHTIPELNRKIYINEVSLSDAPPKIDLYTGTISNYDYERPDGATIWILTEESD